MNDAQSIHAIHDGEVGLVEWHDFVSNEAFHFEGGGSVPSITLRYETYGRLNRNKSNAILVCHALSGDHHAAGVHDLNDRKTGWWNNLIGPGKAIDTSKFFVICSNCLGGCQGSTGPSSINPLTNRPYGLDFPALSLRDMVRAQTRLIDFLGIERLHAVVGGSMGGMQAMLWAIDYPERVSRLLPMATTARQNAQAIAFNEVGRCAIMQDTGWQNGNYTPGNGPNVGLSIARMMAHITYLSDQGLEEKFGRRQRAERGREHFGIEFEVESYLRYQGRSFVNRFDANTYLYFTKALDRFDLYQMGDGALENMMQQIQAEVLIVAITSDWLFPPQQNRSIAHALMRLGKSVSYAELDMPQGHDAFFVEAPELYDIVRSFLERQ